MKEIKILDNHTIDQIAAGEVVERPASVVKELVENAIDAYATSITVEIKEGGISFIRVTDNGSGIEKEQMKRAFLRHATSKIETVSDLAGCLSLGFRGEALASISAVSMVECISKTKEELTGIRYQLQGATELGFEEIGAPNGTTFIIRNLFFNTPARKKFLKTPQTEASYITDMMEHIALSRPDISFSYLVNGSQKFHTAGNHNLKDVIYKIYGKEILRDLTQVQFQNELFTMNGYLGKPGLNRANRNFETFFVNQRYIKSNLLSKALEEGFSPYLMLHKFPFAVLHLEMEAHKLDVNVHPTKMEVRFEQQNMVFDSFLNAIQTALRQTDLIQEVPIDLKFEQEPKLVQKVQRVPEPFEINRINQVREERQIYFTQESPSIQESQENQEMHDILQNTVLSKVLGTINSTEVPKNEKNISNIIKPKEQIIVEKAEQLGLFQEQLLQINAKESYQILGQLFSTYWMIAYSDKLFMVDQHAAHEKVKYESLLQQMNQGEVLSQNINPPLVVKLTGKEEDSFLNHQDAFLSLGFEIDCFGGNDYTLRAIPMELYGSNAKEMFLVTLDELAEYFGKGGQSKAPSVILEKIASMSCKAAVKGNQAMKEEEFKALFDQLMRLENPYNCPHGRPTIISMSKYEIEKKFKRIL